MKRGVILTTSRVDEMYKEMLDCRRRYCADDQFFRMTELWDYMCAGSKEWQIKTYRSNQTEDYKRKAGVIAFEDRVTLTVDEKLMANAEQDCKLSNFILAHEMGHLALNHHSKSAVTKNFQLFACSNGMSNRPPTLEELEANYAAVFLQCGAALSATYCDPLQLAHRAFSDVYYIKKSMRIVQLDAFQRELVRQTVPRRRAVL